MKWAISVVISKNENIERRLEKLVTYVIMNNQIEHFFIYNIDATGHEGNLMTKRLNTEKGKLEINDKDLSTLITEEGQIFELDLVLRSSFEYRFIIRDGYYLDVVGNGQRLPEDIVGIYEELDVNLFL